MKIFLTVVALAVTIMLPEFQCHPGGYEEASGGDSYGKGGMDSYGKGGMDSYGKGGMDSYGKGEQMEGYKGSYASDALKKFVNNNDGYKYDFAYDIQDPKYMNFQSRQESGTADKKGEVTGTYSLMEADGSMRTVDYIADWINGFRATVRDKNGVTMHGFGKGDNGDEGSDGGDKYGAPMGGGGGDKYGGGMSYGAPMAPKGYGGESMGGGGYGGGAPMGYKSGGR